jgi:hypothetical protein
MNKQTLHILILSCGRSNLLRETLRTFHNKAKDIKNYNIIYHIHEDSADVDLSERCHKEVSNYAQFNTELYFMSEQENIGQSASYMQLLQSVDKHSKNDNDLLFLLEDDWQFISDFYISRLSNILQYKTTASNIIASILRTDVDNFHTYQEQGYNICKYNRDEMIILPDCLKNEAISIGDCAHSNIISFHPHLILWKYAKVFLKKYENQNLNKINHSAEKMLGANHIGNYRIHSVFAGAKIRSGVSVVDVETAKRIK